MTPDTLLPALLADLYLTDPTELQLAESWLQRTLNRLTEDRLPLTEPLRERITLCALAKLHAHRALRATQPAASERATADNRAIPAAQFSAASSALKELHRLTEALETALERHKADHATQPVPLEFMTDEERAAANDKHWDTLVHDLHIPICGLAVDRQPARLQALARALKDLHKQNQFHLRSGLPAPYQIPDLPPDLLPTPPPAP